MRAEPSTVPISEPTPESRDLLEIYCYLACMGADCFEREKAVELVTSHSGPDRARLVGTLLDPGQRESRSREIGQLLAENLANREGETGNVISALLPALAEADTVNGFTVLHSLAAAASQPISEAFSEVLLSLTIAESTAFHSDRPRFVKGKNDRSVTIKRIRYLVSVITSLNLEASIKTRLFLALSQTLEDGELIRDVVLTSIFPSDSTESKVVFLEGNEKALLALLDGAASRPNGKAEFYNACRAVMDLGFERGLPTLARIYRILNGPESGARAMSSMVRASVLLALEKASMKVKDLKTMLPEKPDLSSLDLLTIVAPGIKEPHRTSVCDYLVSGSHRLLVDGHVPADDCDCFSQVVVGASVLHSDPEKIGARVRKMFLDTMGVLHVHRQPAAGGRNGSFSEFSRTVHPFSRIVDKIASEFRRRETLSTCLTNVIPLVSNLGSPDSFTGTQQLEAFPD